MNPISADQMARVKATAPILAEHGATITKYFYQRIFERHPELKNLFNQSHQKTGSQPETLAKAVYACAANIDNLAALGGAVSHIAHRHASLNIRPEHYPIVGENLLAAIVEVLGDAVDAETLEAWRVAYGHLSRILIGTEENLYASAAWSGFRPFRVARKVRESDEITSFYLKPADGGAAPSFAPGQYISVKRFVGDMGVNQPRQYTLSDAPNGEWLRISVKREAGKPDVIPAGKVSTLMHDLPDEGAIVEITAPMGDFLLKQDSDAPVVLISGGVGLTPMVSMASTLMATGSKREVRFVHACRSRAAHAFRDWLNDAVREHANVKRTVVYEVVGPNDQVGTDHDLEGRLTPARIEQYALVSNADYYICGPVAFMKAQRDALLALGVAAVRLNTEIFGSGSLE